MLPPSGTWEREAVDPHGGSSPGSLLVTVHNNSQIMNRACLDCSAPHPPPPPPVSHRRPAFFSIRLHTSCLTLQWLLLSSILLCITMKTTFPKSHHTRLPEPSAAPQGLEAHTPWLRAADAILLPTSLTSGAPFSFWRTFSSS